LISQPGFPVGDIDADGASVNLFTFDPLLGWRGGDILTSPTVADFRRFGDRVQFSGAELALVRENNFLGPLSKGVKGRVLIYRIDP
jgi:hypothetical protein